MASINKNMRCIEMQSTEFGNYRDILINKNMRCIEIVVGKVQVLVVVDK